MVDRPSLTRKQIAELHHVSIKTVNRWAAEPGWPDPLPTKHGNQLQYDAVAVAAAIAGHSRRPQQLPAAGPGLLTLHEIADRYGLTYKTVTGYAARGELGPRGEDGLYPADQVHQRLGGRRRYRRSGERNTATA